jgi:hypothetical protein
MCQRGLSLIPSTRWIAIKDNLQWPKYINEGLKHLHPNPFFSLDEVMAGFEIESEQVVDKVNTYSANSKKFRSPEFIENPDILTFGCSQTWGVGIPDNAVWPKVLSELTGMSYANIAVSGSSIMEDVMGCISYIEDYGQPKYIVGLMPDIRRLAIYMNPRVNAAILDSRLGVSWEERTTGEAGITPVHFPVPEREVATEKDVDSLSAKFSKKPHVVSEVLAYEVPLIYSVHYLEFLRVFCEARGIELILSSWDDDSVDVFRTINLKNFCFLEYERDTKKYDSGEVYYTNNCHEDMSNVYGQTWYRGDDHTEDNEGHMGIHRHLDYAEMFASKILK